MSEKSRKTNKQKKRHTPLCLTPPFFQEQSNQSCSQSETPPSCRGAARLAGNLRTLFEWAGPGAGSHCSSDQSSPHTQAPPSCQEAGTRHEDRWGLWEGPGPGPRRSFCYRRILIGLWVPGGCSRCGF